MDELLRDLVELLASPRAEVLLVGVTSLPAMIWIVVATTCGQRYPERCRGEK